jgi:TatD DNase family protein
MTATYIDSHAHLTGDAVFEQIDDVLQRAQAAGVTDIINICTDATSLQRGLDLVCPWVHHAAATTPHDVEKWGKRDFGFIAQCARSGLLKAVGETGLDYYYEHSARELQKHFLRQYLHLALECSLPVVIHCREAFADFFEILDAEYTVNGKLAPGVLHCFTGTMQEAEEVLKRGWMLSLSGIVTFKKSIGLQDVAKHVPLDQLLIETDTPYLAPQSHRGKPNEPAYVIETAHFIAALKGIAPAEIARITADNARTLFKIGKE